ncbi:MAG: type I restriction-modification enzyme R subunit C-terminal domain-containing protein, partial [Candidatus Limnocylindrales bacterium]
MKTSKYIVRITGDSPLGKKELDNFIDPSARYPVIATTSKLLNTGVDVQTCKVIVLDSPIESMTEFKQIIGRGSRVREDYGKTYFTIMDFRQVTNLFADPNFDGVPVQSLDFTGDEPIELTEPGDQSQRPSGQEQVHIPPEAQVRPAKYYVNGVEVRVLNERVQIFDKNGRLITQSLKDYTRQSARSKFKSLDGFLQEWKDADKKSAMTRELIEQGIFISELREEVGKDYDDFDLVCHVAFDQKLRTRKERASVAKEDAYFDKYGKKARAVIDALLDKYSDEGIDDVENISILKVNPFPKFGTPVEIVGLFGGKAGYSKALQEIEERLYA